MRIKSIIHRMLPTVFACVQIVGCGDRALQEQEAPSATLPRTIEVGTTLYSYQLTRVQRTRSELATRAALFAGVLHGTPLPTPTTWAARAVGAPAHWSVDTPFITAPNLEIRYRPYDDLFGIRDRALGAGTIAELQQTNPSTQPDPGIGKAAARTIAQNYFSSSIQPHLPDTTYQLVEARRIVDRASDPVAGGSWAWVRTYIFRFRRHRSGYPLYDSLVEVGVHRSGVVSRLLVGDVDVSQSVRARSSISETDARQVMLDSLAEDLDHLASPPQIILRNERIGYMLPPGTTADEQFPNFIARVTYVSNTVSKSEVAAVNFVEPKLGAVKHLPWSGARTPTGPSPDGRVCVRDVDCASGQCFLFGSVVGYCGECTTDSDCSWGCTAPVPFADPPVGSHCGTGALGDGCKDNSACAGATVCAEIASSAALGLSLRTCSGCASDAECPAAQSCAPRVGWSSHTAYRVCRADGSLTHTEACDNDAQCMSGICSNYEFADGTAIGVCGACLDASDCSPGTDCTPSKFFVDIGFVGSRCE
ncbi:MAG: hypothetical protein JKY37_04055 [Nannocystaceae bacterium]|nr:hypothetical protein [Nannocystaceae bacterium]